MKTARSVILFASVCALAVSAAAASVAAPPAINLPAGGKVVTEINVSDEDVLGMVKSSIPAIADVLKNLTAGESGSSRALPEWAKSISTQELSEAISGVRGIRVIIARYAKPIEPEKFVEQFGMGVVKLGQFNSIATDFGTLPVAAGLYAAPENAGMVGFAYSRASGTAYAVRIVGGLDLPKLIHWAGEVARLALGTKPGAVPVLEPSAAPQ